VFTWALNCALLFWLSLYAFHSPIHSRYMPRTSHSPWLDRSNYTWRRGYTLWSSSVCSFLQRPVTSSLSCPNILLSTLFSNTLTLYSSLNVRNKVSYLYRITERQGIYLRRTSVWQYYN
jgi:hypothetical protein